MRRIYILVSVVLMFVGYGCGNSEKSESASTIEGSFLELQKTIPSNSASLISAFGYITGESSGAYVAFFTGNRYFSGFVQKVHASYYRIMAVVGTYDDSSGLRIKPQAYKTTCQSWTTRAKSTPNKTTILGGVNGSSILVSRDSVTTQLPRIEVQSSIPSGGITVEWGCFNAVGMFTPEVWSTI